MNDVGIPVRETFPTTRSTRGPTGLRVEFAYYLSATKGAPVETPVKTPVKTPGKTPEKTPGKSLVHLRGNPYAQLRESEPGG